MSSISSPDPDSIQSRKKRRKIDNTASSSIDHSRWRTESEQRIYSSNLFQALRRINGNDKFRLVRDSADQVLAIRAKGRTRWSRNIVRNRLKMRLNQINKIHKRAKIRKAITGNVTGDSGLKKTKTRKKTKEEEDLEGKVNLLGRLVPGCSKVSFPNLLEETTDYIAALQMQVRAMTALTELLAGGDDGVVPPALSGVRPPS